MKKVLETTEIATKQFGEKLAGLLQGGEVIELIGDVGAGKTTFTKGLAKGLGVSEEVQSPSFTISRRYGIKKAGQLAHYDFYRLNEPGIMAAELAETMVDPQTITVIEWAETVANILPADRITIRFSSPSPGSRLLEIQAPDRLESRL